jgi:hypothetical protein
MANKVKFSFLSAGPRFVLDLPDDFETPPELSSPLTINNGYAARSFDFVPPARDTGIDEPHRLQRTMRDRGGRTVELYERIEEPRQWYLRWILRNGFLYTHVREEDGLDKVDGIVAGLGIVEANASAPFLLPEPPLGRAVSGQPGYQEFASFRSVERGWGVLLQRPGFIGPGKLMRMPESSKVVYRAGANHGVEVTVVAGEDAAGGRELVTAVAQSLAQE